MRSLLAFLIRSLCLIRIFLSPTLQILIRNHQSFEFVNDSQKFFSENLCRQVNYSRKIRLISVVYTKQLYFTLHAKIYILQRMAYLQFTIFHSTNTFQVYTIFLNPTDCTDSTKQKQNTVRRL